MSFESVDDASIMDANSACQENYTGRRNSDGSTGTFSLTASLESVNNESAMNANNACQERDTSRIDSDEEENRDVFESVNDVDDASTKDANTCNACQERDTGKNENNEEENTCRENPTPMNHQKIVRFSSDDLVESVDDASTKDANTACQESDTDKIDNGEEKVIKPKPMRSIILSLPSPPIAGIFGSAKLFLIFTPSCYLLPVFYNILYTQFRLNLSLFIWVLFLAGYFYF